MNDRGKYLEQLKRELATELVYRRTHGHEHSPGVIDELHAAIRYVAEQIRTQASAR